LSRSPTKQEQTLPEKKSKVHRVFLTSTASSQSSKILKICLTHDPANFPRFKKTKFAFSECIDSVSFFPKE
jgi:hypothetical protein